MVLGEVPDVRPYILGSDLCVAPFESGTGVRIKTLEYLSAGKATISTPPGAAGVESAPSFLTICSTGQFAQTIVHHLMNGRKGHHAPH